MKAIYIYKRIAFCLGRSFVFQDLLPEDQTIMAVLEGGWAPIHSSLGKNGGIYMLSPNITPEAPRKDPIVIKARSNPQFESTANAIAKFYDVAVPDCRLISSSSPLHGALKKHMGENLAPNYSDAFLLFSPVKGFSFTELTPLQGGLITEAHFEQLGRLAALDIVLNNTDRFPHIDMKASHSNPGNYMIHQEGLTCFVVGVDQSISQIDKKSNTKPSLVGHVRNYVSGNSAKSIVEALPPFIKKRFSESGIACIQAGMKSFFDSFLAKPESDLELVLKELRVDSSKMKLIMERIKGLKVALK